MEDEGVTTNVRTIEEKVRMGVNDSSTVAATIYFTQHRTPRAVAVPMARFARRGGDVVAQERKSEDLRVG